MRPAPARSPGRTIDDFHLTSTGAIGAAAAAVAQPAAAAPPTTAAHTTAAPVVAAPAAAEPAAERRDGRSDGRHDGGGSGSTSDAELTVDVGSLNKAELIGIIKILGQGMEKPLSYRENIVRLCREEARSSSAGSTSRPARMP